MDEIPTLEQAWKAHTAGPELDFVMAMWADDLCSRALGMVVVEAGLGPHRGTLPGLGYATVTMTVTDRMVNGHAIAHGGFIFTLCDSAFAVACNAKGSLTVASGCDINYIAPARLGDKLVARAQETAGYGRNGITDVTVTREGDDDLLAVFRGRSRTLAKPATHW